MPFTKGVMSKWKTGPQTQLETQILGSHDSGSLHCDAHFNRRGYNLVLAHIALGLVQKEMQEG